jgi:uncharacterized protein
VQQSSRRDFLGSFAPVALLSLLGDPPEMLFSRNEAGGTTDQKGHTPAGATDKVKAVKVDRVECPSWPLQSLGAVVVDGNPDASGKNVFESEDHQITGGVWKCSPGTFDLTFTWDEMALLMEGELVIEEPSGRKVRILPGDFFTVPRGAKTRWNVIKPIKKLFFSRE